MKIIIYQYWLKSESMPRRSGGDDWPKFQREDPGVTSSSLHGSYTKTLLCGVGVGGCECEWTAGHGESDVSDDWNGQWTAWTKDRHRRLEHQLHIRRSLVHLDVVLQTTVLYHTNRRPRLFLICCFTQRQLVMFLLSVFATMFVIFAMLFCS